MEIKKNLEKIILAGTTILGLVETKVKSVINLKKYLRNTTTITILVAGTVAVAGLGGLALTLDKYFQTKQEYNKLSQEYKQVFEENKQISQENEQQKQKNTKTLEDLTREYKQLLTKNEQLNQNYKQLSEENKQLQQYYDELNKKYTELVKEHERISQETILLTQTYQTIAKENEELKQKQEELRKKDAKTLKELTKKHIPILEYNSEYGFPYYKPGLLNKHYNWDSNDVLDNQGWQVINKEFESLLSPQSINVLCFKPVSDFNSFSPEDNYAIFHLYSDKPIKSFVIGGQYLIQKNGYLDIFVSGDNKNWLYFRHFDSRGRDDVRFAWGHTPYYPHHWEKLGLKLDKDLYIRHSTGAISNKNYEVEIWKVSFSVIRKDKN